MRMGWMLARVGGWAAAAVGLAALLGGAPAAAQTTVNLASVRIDGAGTGGRIGEGATTTVTAVLDRALPSTATATVMLALQESTTVTSLETVGSLGFAESSDITLGLTTITIPAGAISGSVSAIFNQDDTDAFDEKFLIKATLTSVGTGAAVGPTTERTVAGTIVDNETQGYRMTVNTAAVNLKEGGNQFSGSLQPVPAVPANEKLEPVYLRLPTGYTVGAPWTTGVTFSGGGSGSRAPSGHPAANASQAFSVTTPLNDKNRTDDAATLEFIQGSIVSSRVIVSQTVTVLDIHALPTSVSAVAKSAATGGSTVTAVREGGTVYLDVSYLNTTSDRVSDSETFRITAAPGPGQQGDVRLTGSPLTAAGAGTSGGVKAAGQLTLAALVDQDVGDERVVIELTLEGDAANGPGQVTGRFEIAVEDATVREVWPKSDAALRAAVAAAVPSPFNPPACFSVRTASLFNVLAGRRALYGGRSDSPAFTVAASGEAIRVCAVAAGTGTVTVTATVSPSSVTSSQTVANVAEVSFDVTVVLQPLAVTVTAAPLQIEEGGASTITATANRPVVDNTEIALTVAGDRDAYTVPDSIMIARGQMSGSVELRAAEDADLMDETLTVSALGPGIAGVQRLQIMVTDNDVPAVAAKPDAADQITAAVVRASGGGEWRVGATAATVDMGLLFDVDEGARPSYTGGSSDSGVVQASSSGRVLTLTPVGPGRAVISVTASDSVGGESATVTAEVRVTLQPLSVTVTADATTVEEGGTVTLTATANRGVTADTAVTLTVGGEASAVAVPPSITIPAGGVTGTAVLGAVEDDDDTADAQVTVVAAGPGIAAPIVIPISVIDNDPTVRARPQAEVDAVFAVAAVRAGGAGGWRQGGPAATVNMSDLFAVIGRPVVRYAAESSRPGTVRAAANGPVLTLEPRQEGTSEITVTATDTGGDDRATVTAEVAVGARPLAFALSPAAIDVEEGGSATISATANRILDENVEVMLVRDGSSAAGPGDYSLDPPLITIMAGQISGSLTLKAADDREVEGPEHLTLVGRAGGVSAGSVRVNIADNDTLLRYELSAEAENLAEGQSAALTATSCAATPAGACVKTPVQMDVKVEIRRDGSSTASEADFRAGSMTIRAGEVSASGLLSAVEDGQPDAGSGSPEVLTLYGMADGMQTNTVSIYLWDAAVPALPAAGLLLLAAWLAAAGYRRCRR